MTVNRTRVSAGSVSDNHRVDRTTVDGDRAREYDPTRRQWDGERHGGSWL